MTTQRLRVSGFVVVDCSYETEVDVPAEYVGREIEFLEEQGLLPSVASNHDERHMIGLALGSFVAVKWDIKPDCFKPAVAEVIE